MPPTTSYVLAVPLARSLVEHSPNVSLRVVEGYGAHLVDWLQRGEIDAALLYGPASDFHLNAEELLIEEIRLGGPPDSNLTSETPVSFRDLAKLHLIMPSHPPGLRINADKAAARAHTPTAVRLQAAPFGYMK